jgi:hypothetical protein
VAAVLFGDYNPAGRTHTTWYRSNNDLPGMAEMDLYAGKGISYRCGNKKRDCECYSFCSVDNGRANQRL